ncbi:hypothetical protein MKW94_008997 [Papaver nudicaule]|uniref:NAC domain-containing protein n=1 Tax=Papaver nudicaule TaxID=74823 RepID=A0AA41V272_PAPNU|nr:hypothetical protein [Papaver nudicaule]MCL7050618.1 hypothetical protein [Papaver nudicaule]
MARSWLIDGKAIATKVKNASHFSSSQIKDCGASRECPNCLHRIDNSDVAVEWPGFPAGVKFDPTDSELLEHLTAKLSLGSLKPHTFIEEFIPTLQSDEGICYTHPKNLPGAKKDGNSVHFFHRISKAYATGHRKRRRIHGEPTSTEEHVRWHKTGKTKPVIHNGTQKGFKKIMVLYKSSTKGSKPDKSSWVMHQYHLGTNEEEMEGEFVVSKIFYQQPPKHTDTGDVQPTPSTPNTSTPNPPRPEKRPKLDELDKENIQYPSVHQDVEVNPKSHQLPAEIVCLGDERSNAAWWAGESQAVDDLDPDGIDNSLLCHENFEMCYENFEILDESGIKQVPYPSGLDRIRNDMTSGDISTAFGLSDLDSSALGTPPDFDLADLQFGSQESITGWLDRL